MKNYPILSIESLSIGTEFKTIVSKFDLKIFPGESVAIVGESGSGKSLTVLSILDLLPKPSVSVKAGKIFWQEKNLTSMTNTELRQIRGKEIGIIFQEPMTALNPLQKIRVQMEEVFKIHGQKASEQKLISLLESVWVHNPKRVLSQYPHEISGGMKQRVMIAIAIGFEPKLLIADEPTTALDVTVQAEVIRVIKELQLKTKMALLIVTHDIALVSEISERIVVMKNGCIQEVGDTKKVIEQPESKYTQSLMNSVLSEHKKPRVFSYENN